MKRNPIVATPQNIRRFIFSKININKSYYGTSYDDKKLHKEVSSHFKLEPYRSDISFIVQSYWALYTIIFFSNLTKTQKENLWRYYMIETPVDFSTNLIQVRKKLDAIEWDINLLSGRNKTNLTYDQYLAQQKRDRRILYPRGYEWLID